MTPTADLLALRFRSLGRFFWAQGFAYWAMCLYLVFEYVRPQQLIGPLNALPVGQIVLGAALLGHLFSGRWFAMKGSGSWLLLVFTAVIVLSSLTAADPSVAIGQWRLWFSWIAVYFLIINVVNSEQRLVVFTVVLADGQLLHVAGGCKAIRATRLHVCGLGRDWSPGLVQQLGGIWHRDVHVPCCRMAVLPGRSALSNEMAQAVCLLMPLTAILGIIGSSSRGALLGLGALGVWLLLRTKHRVRSAVGVAVLAGAVWLIVPQEFKERFSAAGEDYTSQTRETYWRHGLEMAREHPVLGIGYGNWLTYYSKHYVDPTAHWYDPEGRVQVSHNIFIQCMAELGYVGLGAFLLLILATLRLNYHTRRLARAGPGAVGRASRPSWLTASTGRLISYLVCGFFVTVLYYPFFWINFAFTVALNAIARRNQRDRASAVATGRTVPGQVVLREVAR